MGIVEHSSPAERPRHRSFVRNRCLDVGFGTAALLDRASKRIEPFEAAELVGVPKLGRVERAAKDGDRFVVDLERHRKRMADPCRHARTRSGPGRRIWSGRRGRLRRRAPAIATFAVRAARAGGTTRSRAGPVHGPAPAPRRAASRSRPSRARHDGSASPDAAASGDGAASRDDEGRRSSVRDPRG